MNFARNVSLQLLVCPVLILWGSQAVAQQATAPDRDRGRDAAVQREGGIPRSEVSSDANDAQQGTEEGMPQQPQTRANTRIQPHVFPPQSDQWKLGVYAHNTDTGVVVTRTVPNTAAQAVGLERGDRIVAVSGYQVGWIQDRLYPLGAELNRRASHRGHVTLLVQNVRTDQLINLEVRLDAQRRFRTQERSERPSDEPAFPQRSRSPRD
ncbi:PDZ/DHR/GLGF domain protein [Rhodopirellula maiorica SM1]|uniref:PDZ/DHR/GLGF domain protein n=1 Tax=Rhodopirellula maiorica SM1 TaxID=1265738 RepID=M5RSA9_9BACT|nr:PDZ domain-containing protein [Rhodopirellula maiorica]EMI16829.1 PDZ/DHR/GLGF domain protein [Rhodopirellula maiorica SM1]